MFRDSESCFSGNMRALGQDEKAGRLYFYDNDFRTRALNTNGRGVLKNKFYLVCRSPKGKCFFKIYPKTRRQLRLMNH